jgi:CubicO group peptidase (beta-lactamase class C family)
MEHLYTTTHHIRYYALMLLPVALVFALASVGFKIAGWLGATATTWPAPVRKVYEGTRIAKPFLIAYVVVFILGYVGGIFSAFALEPMKDGASLAPTLERVIAAHRLPAAGVAIVSSEGVQSLAVAGVRKRGEKVPVTETDQWHLGSNGKAMTAAMIARLVEHGAMRWDQTLAETFPELAEKMNAEAKAVTVAHLLSHCAGIDANFDMAKYWAMKDMSQARLQAVKDAIATPLKFKPGEKHAYSNWGYAIISAMAERVTNKSFETLLQEEVFGPLGIKSAGFQGIGTPGKIDQPWPHFADGKVSPQNGPEADNPRAMAAAGTVHMSLPDYAKFIREMMRALQGKSDWIKKATAERLAQPTGGDYALGWISLERPWADGRALTHAGDNNGNFALVWIALKPDRAIIFVTNQSQAMGAGNDIVIATLVKPLQSKK